MTQLTRQDLITLRRQLISTQRVCERMLPAIDSMLAQTRPETRRVSAVKASCIDKKALNRVK